MCVRNLNSYGCGCNYPEVNDCGMDCEPLTGYKFIREYDCRKCKEGGQAVTRGQDGLGRYAQSIKRREQKEEIQSVTGPVIDSNGDASAWASSPVNYTGAKSWHKGRRRDADEAWQEEHSKRMDDISSRAEQMSLRSDDTTRPARSQYRRSPSPVDVSSSDDYDRKSHRSRSSKELCVDIPRTRNDNVRHSPRRSDYAGSRYESQDSLDIIPRSRGRSAAHKQGAYDPYDSGYSSGSYRSHGSHKPPAQLHRSQTAPSVYSTTTTQRYVYQQPVSPTQYGYPQGTYGVEVRPRYVSGY